MDVTFGPLDAFAFVVFAVILAVVVVVRLLPPQCIIDFCLLLVLVEHTFSAFELLRIGHNARSFLPSSRAGRSRRAWF
jgi:hypothetical protein